MKKRISITIDSSLHEEARAKNLNISQICNEGLRERIDLINKTKKCEISEVTKSNLRQQLEIAKKFNLSENEFFLLRNSFDSDALNFWKLNRMNFPNIKNFFDFVKIRKMLSP